MCTICFLLSRTADKESLTTELTKLQQSYRHVKGELASKIEQLTQNEANRRSAEEKIRQLNIHQNSVVRVFILLFLHVFSFSIVLTLPCGEQGWCNIASASHY